MTIASKKEQIVFYSIEDENLTFQYKRGFNLSCLILRLYFILE